MPVYRQVFDHYKKAILDGNIKAGEKLPPVRSLSSALEVSHLTVHRAYQLLADEHLLILRHGSGAYVASIEQRARAEEDLKSFLALDTENPFQADADLALVGNMATLTPDPLLFDPKPLFREMLAQVENDPLALTYPREGGDPALRNEASTWFESLGLACRPDDVFVHAVDPRLPSFTNDVLHPGDHVLIEQPTPLFIAGRLATLGFVPIGIPLKNNLIDLNFLKQSARNDQIKAVYVAPSYGFGTGLAWPAPLRHAVLEMAEKNGWIVIESYSRAPLAFEETPLPLAAESSNAAIVTELNFSELLAPGLPVGFLVLNEHVPQTVRDRLPLACPRPLQPLESVLARQLASGRLQSGIRSVAKEYETRFNAFRDGLLQTLPDGFRLSRVQGGYSAILQAPAPLPPADLFEASVKAEVPVMPGTFLGLRGSCRDLVRINFGSLNSEQAQNAGIRVGEVLRNLMPSLVFA